MDARVDLRPGRRCPAAYGYSPRTLAREAEFGAEVLYVIGGLYGNLPALSKSNAWPPGGLRAAGVQRRFPLVRRRPRHVLR
jgi:hypothetical protein